MNISIFFREDNRLATAWSKKIQAWLRRKRPRVKLAAKKPDAVIVLGGDGAILEAARRFQNHATVILGLNLGRAGFLATLREPKNFLSGLDAFFKGKYHKVERMMIRSDVLRKNKIVFSANALNEITVQNFLGMVELEASISGHPVQYIHGTGAMVSTSTGSTAYNLSAHGPIVMPDIKCMILTEIMDHNIPTPSIVIKRDREVSIKILGFRKRKVLSIAETGEGADVVLSADGELIFPLERGDVVKIRRSPRLVRFAELEPNYFFKSLRDKFAFR